MSIECSDCGNKTHDKDCRFHPNNRLKTPATTVCIRCTTSIPKGAFLHKVINCPSSVESALKPQCEDCGTINGIHPPNCTRFKARSYTGTDPRTEGTPGSDEAVNHPSHYTFGKFEVVDVIFDWQPPYPLDNVIKYVARAGKKGGPEKELEDLKKAQFYLNYYIAAKETEDA